MMTRIISISIMHQFYYKRTMKTYLQDHNMIEQKEWFVVKKYYFDILLNKSNIFEWQV